MMFAADLIARLGTTARIGNQGRSRGRGARVARASSLLAVAGLFGCSTLPPRDDVAAEIAQDYAKHAIEEDGRCPSPEIATVTKRKILASGGDATTLRVRYSYFDDSAAAATGWTRVLQAERACTGFAERDFTLVRGQLGYRVVEMSGAVRAQP